MNEVLSSAVIIALWILLLIYIFHLAAQKFAWKWWYKNFYLRSVHWKFTRWLKKTQMWLLKGSVHCEKCGSKKRLHIHHVTYKRIWRERMSDLQVICSGCHRPGSGRI